MWRRHLTLLFTMSVTKRAVQRWCQLPKPLWSGRGIRIGAAHNKERVSLRASWLRRPKVALAMVAAAGGAAAMPATPAGATRPFAYTGTAQNFTVPANVDSLSIIATGGSGGAGTWLPAAAAEAPVLETPGGRGAIATVTASVTPGQTFIVDVGGRGSALGLPATNGGAAGGFLGGGSGGGASDVCQAPLGATVQPSTCLVVAAGGGGAGGGFGAGRGGNAGQAGATNDAGAGIGGGGGQPGTGSAAGSGGSTGSNDPPYSQPGEFVLGGGPGGSGYVNVPASLDALGEELVGGG